MDRIPISRLPSGRWIPFAAALGCALLILWSGCQEAIEDSGLGIGVQTPEIRHPVVTRDLRQISRSGVLRMITNYNSSRYFIHKGGQAGFDYELVWRFAQEHDLSVEVVVPDPGEDMVSLMNTGRGDIVCAGTVPDPGLERWVAFTRPTNFVQKVVVLPAESNRPATLDGLAGLTLTLPDGDSFREQLQEIRNQSRVPFFVTAARPLVGPEELMAMVGRGELEAVVVDDVIARAAMATQTDVRLGALLGDRQSTVWMVRENSPDLKASLNEFLKKNLKVTLEGRTRRSQLYGVIYDRYFENPLSIKRFRDAAHRPDKSGSISIYDDLIRRKSEAAGLDWRMVAALIYQESRFYPNALSKAGAQGLMQVLPRFAGPQADSLFYPEPNLTAGLRLMKQTLRSYAYLDSLERWRFTLAEFHAGHGHVTDARRLAMEMGLNPNKWEGALSRTLPLLMNKEVYSNLRHGYYGGATTVDYVEEIINRFRMYTRIVERVPQTRPVSVSTDLTGGVDTDLSALPDLTPPPDLK